MRKILKIRPTLNSRLRVSLSLERILSSAHNFRRLQLPTAQTTDKQPFAFV